MENLNRHLEAENARLRDRISDQEDALLFGEEVCARLVDERDKARRERDEALSRVAAEAGKDLAAWAADLDAAEAANARLVAERDEARAQVKAWQAEELARRTERDEARRELGEILAVIHRDGGHYTGEHGISKSVADAHATWAAMVRERDDARDELAKTSADFHDVWESRDKVIEERERARQACNAYWHDLSRIAGLCEQADDEYPLKAVERTVREFAQARAEVERREREHEALLETAQKALAHATAERDEAQAEAERLRSAYEP